VGDPSVAVVVATHNRASRLAALVAALEAQTSDMDAEIVFVDDGSSDGTWAELSRLRDASASDVRILRMPRNRGPAAARNVGWRATAADLVCFTDDDCLPQAGWLTAIVKRLAESDIVQGPTRPPPEQQDEETTFSRTMKVASERGFYETCNIGYRRTVLERANGFDESFRFPFGEDTDLAWRAKEAGASTAFEPRAVVHHEIWPANLRATLRDLRRREGIVLCVRRHPGLRDHFEGRWFYMDAHKPALIALAGALTLVARPRSPARWAAAAAGGYPYLRYRTRTRPVLVRRRRWPVVVPALLAFDLGEVAVLAYASARHRTFLI
jgi:GT2 family glycosyltransferase